MKSRVSKFIKENNKTIKLLLGEITDLQQIGQGGNGLVYSGVLNGETLALKFLVESGRKKLIRFKAEYFNINIIESNKNIVKYITYDEIDIEEKKVPVIVMKKYDNSLSGLRTEIGNDEKELSKLLDFLMDTLELIHKQGIIHRDIKPENILIDNGKYVLGDFGIAKYNEDMFTYKAETEDRERLGNYNFSAPEQSYKGVNPHPRMDIYALGQVCYWFVFGTTHKGTGRSRLSSKLEQSDNLMIMDSIIDKCIRNNPEERFQSIEDIRNHIVNEKNKLKEVDPFDEMYKLNEAIRETAPESYRRLYNTNDNKILRDLIYNINKRNFAKNSVWHTYGTGNYYLKELKYVKDNQIVINGYELFVEELWLYCNDNLYEDLIMIKSKTKEEVEQFNIDGQHSYSAYLVNDSYYVDPDVVESGFIRLDGEVISVNDVKLEHRTRYIFDRYHIIGTEWNCVLVSKNDKIIMDFQKKDVNEGTVKKLIKEIRQNKHNKVVERL